MSTGDPQFDKLAEQANTLTEIATDAFAQRDRLAAINAELVAALQAFMSLDRTFTKTSDKHLSQLADVHGKWGLIPKAVQMARAALAKVNQS